MTGDTNVNEATIQRLENSFKLLAPQGEELVDRFYANLFARHPGVRPMFPANMKDQKSKLLASLVLVIKNLRNPEVLGEAVLGLGGKHEGYGAKPEHYIAVRDTLLDVMEQMAGDTWSQTLTNDWKGALDFIAETMLEGQKQAAAAAIA